MSKLLLAAAERYRSQGRWAYGFARGKLLHDPVYRSVLPLILDGPLVDIGCAEGYLITAVLEQRPDLQCVGLDHDAGRLELARAVLGDEPSVTLVQVDIREWSIDSAKTITCLDVLHYQPVEHQDVLIAGYFRALLPGGVLIIRDAEAQSGVSSWMTRVAEWAAMAVGRHKGDGVYFRSSLDLCEALEAVGFTVERTLCRAGTPFSNSLFVARKAS